VNIDELRNKVEREISSLKTFEDLKRVKKEYFLNISIL